jgi:hypothetical protein
MFLALLSDAAKKRLLPVGEAAQYPTSVIEKSLVFISSILNCWTCGAISSEADLCPEV